MLGELGVGGCALCEALLRCLHAHACISFHQRGQDFSLEASLEEARSRAKSEIGVVMCGIVNNSVKMFKELFTKDTIGVESKGTKGRLFPFRELGIFGSLAVLGLNEKLCWIVGVAKMETRASVRRSRRRSIVRHPAVFASNPGRCIRKWLVCRPILPAWL